LSKKPYLRYALNIGISVLILGFIFTQVSIAQITGSLRAADLALVLLSCALGVLSLILSAWRWGMLLEYLGQTHGFGLLCRLTFTAFFYNNFLPGGVAGEVARVAMLPPADAGMDRQTHLTRITATVVTDRIVGMIGIMLLAFFGFVFSRDLLRDDRLSAVFVLLTLGLLAVFVVLFSRRIQSRVKTLFAAPLRILAPVRGPIRTMTDALFVYRDRYDVFFKTIPVSVAANICVVGYFFFLARSIDVDIGFFKLLLFVPFIEFVSTIPVSLSGVGIREATTILLFASQGVSAAQSIAVSLLTFVVLVVLGAIGAFFFFFRKSPAQPVDGAPPKPDDGRQ